MDKRNRFPMNLFFRNDFEKVFYRDVVSVELFENEEDGKQVIFWFANGEGCRHSVECDDWYIMTEACELRMCSERVRGQAAPAAPDPARRR